MLECPECYDNPDFVCWKDQPMNEVIRERLGILPVKIFYPSFMAAAKEWGTQITEGLNEDK